MIGIALGTGGDQLGGFRYAPNTGAGSAPLKPAPDAIMSANQRYKSDPRVEGEGKINLGIGVCQNSEGFSDVPPFIQNIIESPAYAKQLAKAEYLPGVGSVKFLQCAQKQIFGDAFDPTQVGSVQSIGGTNSLYLVLSALTDAQYDGMQNPFHSATVYVSNPTWGNHKLIPLEAGFGPRGIDSKKNPNVQEYPYLNDQGTGVEFDKLIEFVRDRNDACVFILHASCHNPSGVDLSKDQWNSLLQIIKEKQDAGINIKPLFDCAYQGFGQGFEDDVYAIRKAREIGMSGFVGESYSKKLSLYGHRLGAAHVFSPNPDEVAAFVSIMANVSQRGSGSSCPLSGAVIAQTVLENPANMVAYADEMEKKRTQFAEARKALSSATGVKLDDTNGMFVFLPVKDDVPGNILWDKYGLMTVALSWKDSHGEVKKALRVCLDPINEKNLDWITNGFKEAFGQA